MTATASDPLHGRLPPHRVIAEPLLRFGPSSTNEVSPHPLHGLLTHGPYSRGGFGQQPVRIAIITTPTLVSRLRSFLGSLRDEHQPTDRRSYVPAYPGFQPVYGVDLVPAGESAVALLDEKTADAADPQGAISAALTSAVRRLSAVRSTWDVIVVLLPAAWQRWKASDDDTSISTTSSRPAALPSVLRRNSCGNTGPCPSGTNAASPGDCPSLCMPRQVEHRGVCTVTAMQTSPTSASPMPSEAGRGAASSRAVPRCSMLTVAAWTLSHTTSARAST